MLKAIVLTLKSGFEIALVASFVLVILKQLNRLNLSRWVIGGDLGFAALFGSFSAYNINMVGGREFFEGWITTLGIIATIVLILWVSRFGKAKDGCLECHANGDKGACHREE